jgi:uncharacterized protein (DUF1499 family)
MSKTPKEIREELLSVFLSLEELYRSSPTTSEADQKLAYIEIEMTEHLMGAIQDIMFHYQDDVPEMRIKRKWGEDMLRAQKLLKKYAENLEDMKPKLKKEFDDTGYLENRDFFSDAASHRPRLKRKIM